MSASQKIDVSCPECHAKLAVPIAALGKSGKCPHCQNIFPLAMPARRPAAQFAAPANPLTPVGPNYDAPDGLMPLDGADLNSLPAASSFAPLAANNPFAAPLPESGYMLQPLAPSPYAPQPTLPTNRSIAAEHLANANMAYHEAKSRKHYGNNGEGWGINAGIGGGALMMLGAVVWFVVGLACGYIFFYPPVLFIIGLIAFFKGIADNFSG